ncbi:MAG TPA: sulfurtransferase [Bellilinea sp.]|nr:sulfurtransferase [Bellilinea sp.]
MQAYTNLISADQLHTILHHPNLVIVDCRFDLGDFDWGYEEYQVLHIPGAVYAHMNNDLSAEITPTTGRHPLPSNEGMIALFRKLGISNDSQVVIYDATSGSFAARLWWMLKLYGHENAAVLDGGLPAWLQEGFETVDGIETNLHGSFSGQPDTSMYVTTEQMEEIVADPNSLIIDAKSAERYRGEIEPIDTKAGHIPGALNRFHGLNATPEGLFKAPEQLRQEFSDLTSGRSLGEAVVYCGSGVTSIHHIVAADVAGLPWPKLYVGSWSEWIRDPKHEVVVES